MGIFFLTVSAKMNRRTIEPLFVKSVPRQLEAGVLYVSMEFSTAIHSCCCGCGHEVVTPLSPTGWKLIYDGESVSLRPSIGNWNLPCKSHYFITRNRIILAESFAKDSDKNRVPDDQSNQRGKTDSLWKSVIRRLFG